MTHDFDAGGVTERKEDTNALKERQRLELALESAQMGIWDLDLSTDTAVRNLQHDRIFGYQSLQPKWGTEIFLARVVPDDRDAVKERLAHALAAGRLDIECRIAWPDTSIHWICAMGTVYRDDAGKPVRMMGTVVDITRRKEMETARQQSEATFRVLAESMPQLVWISRPDGSGLYCNQRWVDYSGMTLEQSSGGGWNGIFHPDDRQRAWNEWSGAAATGQAFEMECRLRGADGRYRWFLTTVVPVRDDAGGVVKWLGASTDIDELKQAERSLRERARELKEAQRVAHVGSWDHVFEPDVITWSEELYRIYGVDPKAPVPPFADLARLYTPESWQRLRAELDKAMKNGGSFELDVQIVRTDGALIWATTRGEVLRGADGTMIGTRGTVLDITERKQAEQQLREAALYSRSLIEASLDPLLTISPGGKITDVNRATEEATGIPRAALVGSDFAAGFTERDRARAGYEQTLANGTVRDYPLTLCGTSGRTIDVVFNASVYHNQEGVLQGVFAAARDVTERNRAKQALERLNVELEARVETRTADLKSANEELAAFSYSVSHDLRAPLRALQGFSRILIEDHLPQLSGEAARYLGLIRDNAARMGKLIDDLLAFSRLNQQPVHAEPVDVGMLVRQAQEQLSGEFEHRQIDVRVAELPRCWGDPSLLRLVLINLLSNALKFTGRRSQAIIEVGLAPELGGPGEHVYFVRDNGAGFDMKYADKLFGVFQRLHSSSEYEGNGVGLATVQRIVHRHGGRVWADAAVDRGATFYLALPKDGPHGT